MWLVEWLLENKICDLDEQIVSIKNRANDIVDSRKKFNDNIKIFRKERIVQDRRNKYGKVVLSNNCFIPIRKQKMI